MLARHGPKIAASLVIAVGFAWMLRQGGLPLVPPRAAFAEFRWWSVPGYVLILAVALFFRCYRWVYLLRPVAEIPLRRVLAVNLIGNAAIFLAPLRTGELVRPYLISEHGEISFVQAAGTVAAERIIDGLVLSLILFVGLQTSTAISPLPTHLGQLPLHISAIPTAAYGVLTLFAGAFVTMGVFYWRRELARRLTYRVVGLISKPLAAWLTDKVERVADGLRFLPSPAHSLPFLRYTLLYWASNLFGMWFLLRGCGILATLPQMGVLMGVLGVGIVLPAGPGFFGAFQLSIYSALAMFFPEETVVGAGAAYVFVLYSTQVVVSILAAALGFFLDRGAPAAARAAA